MKTMRAMLFLLSFLIPACGGNDADIRPTESNDTVAVKSELCTLKTLKNKRYEITCTKPVDYIRLGGIMISDSLNMHSSNFVIEAKRIDERTFNTFIQGKETKLYFILDDGSKATFLIPANPF